MLLTSVNPYLSDSSGFHVRRGRQRSLNRSDPDIPRQDICFDRNLFTTRVLVGPRIAVQFL